MPHKEINEADLERIIAGRRKILLDNHWKTIFKYLFSFIFLCLIFYVILNYHGISKNLAYWYDNQFGTQEPGGNIDALTNKNIGDSEIAISLPKMENNTVFIPSINITAPISWRVPNEDAPLQVGLSKGVIQLEGTAMPGQVGNIFITGHSSNYVWAKGDYNQVFALLHNLVAGDKVYIKYNNVTYLYEVKTEKVVKPNDLSVLEQGKTSVLTLMTCTPVGTNYRRLIVTANQIYPDPKKNTDFSGSATTSSLPKAR